METLHTIAKLISIAFFLAILFYFLPRAHDRLRAKGQSYANRPWQFRMWWTTFGWSADPEAVVALLWFALLGVALGLVAVFIDAETEHVFRFTPKQDLRPMI